MSVDVAEIGGRVRTLRDRLGWSAADLADRAGIFKDTVLRLERGAKGEVSLRVLTGLAAALGVPVGVLLGEQPLPLHWPVDRFFWGQVRREVGEIQAQVQGVA